MILLEFPHKNPKGYSYEFKVFKKNIIAIWIHNNRTFHYKNGKSVSSIWGFYNQKTKKYYSPVNSTTIGECIDISDTTPYSAMLIHKTALEMAFV